MTIVRQYEWKRQCQSGSLSPAYMYNSFSPTVRKPRWARTLARSSSSALMCALTRHALIRANHLNLLETLAPPFTAVAGEAILFENRGDGCRQFTSVGGR